MLAVPPERIPRRQPNPQVGNQKPDYLQQTLGDLRDNVRKNAAAMAAIVRGWSDDDIAAMSRYLAGL